jgi:hypothetical protein
VPFTLVATLSVARSTPAMRSEYAPIGRSSASTLKSVRSSRSSKRTLPLATRTAPVLSKNRTMRSPCDVSVRSSEMPPVHACDESSERRAIVVSPLCWRGSFGANCTLPCAQSLNETVMRPQLEADAPALDELPTTAASTALLSAIGPCPMTQSGLPVASVVNQYASS